MAAWKNLCRRFGCPLTEDLPSILKMMTGSTREVLRRRLELSGERVVSIERFVYGVSENVDMLLVVELGESGMTAEEAFDGLVAVPGDTNA